MNDLGRRRVHGVGLGRVVVEIERQRAVGDTLALVPDVVAGGPVDAEAGIRRAAVGRVAGARKHGLDGAVREQLDRARDLRRQRVTDRVPLRPCGGGLPDPAVGNGGVEGLAIGRVVGEILDPAGELMQAKSVGAGVADDVAVEWADSDRNPGRRGRGRGGPNEGLLLRHRSFERTGRHRVATVLANRQLRTHGHGLLHRLDAQRRGAGALPTGSGVRQRDVAVDDAPGGARQGRTSGGDDGLRPCRAEGERPSGEGGESRDEWAGVHRVLLVRACCDPRGAESVGASVGAMTWSPRGHFVMMGPLREPSCHPCRGFR